MDQARLASEYSNLSSIYDPQRALVQQQVTALPGEYEAQKSALEQAKINAFRDIQNVAQSRGVSFSGFTPSEQASYTGTKYLPALASLSSQQNQAKYNLQKALLDIESQQRGQATSNLQNIMNREQQQRQFEQQLAASRAAAASSAFDLSSLFGGGGGTAAGDTTTPSGGGTTTAADYNLSHTPQSGYQFTDPSGKAISAVQFAQGKGTPFFELLRDMAKAGDVNAKLVLPYASRNFTRVPQNLAGAMSALGLSFNVPQKSTYVNPTQPKRVYGGTNRGGQIVTNRTTGR